jgi:cytochrome c-type biogenesis protein CcmH/NrfG
MSVARQAVLLQGALLLLGALVLGSCRGGDQAAPAGGSGVKAPSGQAEQQLAPSVRGVIEEHRSVLAKDPHNLAAIIGLGNALYESGSWGEAVLAYEQALRIDPHSAEVLTDMGTCYRNLGMYSEAVKAFDKALAFEPTNQDALFHLGAIYAYDRKDRAKAIAVWDRLLHVAPKHPRADEIRSAVERFRADERQGAS